MSEENLIPTGKQELLPIELGSEGYLQLKVDISFLEAHGITSSIRQGLEKGVVEPVWIAERATHKLKNDYWVRVLVANPLMSEEPDVGIFSGQGVIIQIIPEFKLYVNDAEMQKIEGLKAEF